MNIKTITIESIHFGTIPTLLESPKVLWLQFRFPPPCDLQVNKKVAVLDSDNQILGLFYLDDVVGTRVILSSLDREHPKPVRECDVFARRYTQPNTQCFSAGQSMRSDEGIPGIKDWLCGTGISATQLAYIGV